MVIIVKASIIAIIIATRYRLALATTGNVVASVEQSEAGRGGGERVDAGGWGLISG